jgi:hypothetical protein
LNESDDPSPLESAARRGLELFAIQAAERAAIEGFAESTQLEKVLDGASEFVAALVASSHLESLLPGTNWEMVEVVARTAGNWQHTEFRKWDMTASNLKKGYYRPRAVGAVLVPSGADTAIGVAVVEAEVHSDGRPAHIAAAEIHVVRYMNTGTISFSMGWRSLGRVNSADQLGLAVAQYPQGLKMTLAQATEVELRKAVGSALDAELKRPRWDEGRVSNRRGLVASNPRRQTHGQGRP